MAYYEYDPIAPELITGEGCDIKIWSGDCRHNGYLTKGDKYLCAACGKILNLNHEVHHEGFPHIVGDTDVLS